MKYQVEGDRQTGGGGGLDSEVAGGHVEDVVMWSQEFPPSRITTVKNDNTKLAIPRG